MLARVGDPWVVPPESKPKGAGERSSLRLQERAGWVSCRGSAHPPCGKTHAPVDGDGQVSDEPVVFRWAVGAVTATAIAGGIPFAALRRRPETGGGSPDLGLLLFVGLALLPTVMFLVWVRSPWRTAISGTILLLATASGWLFYYLILQGADTLIGVYIGLSWFVALGTSMWAATSDSDYRNL